MFLDVRDMFLDVRDMFLGVQNMFIICLRHVFRCPRRVFSSRFKKRTNLISDASYFIFGFSIWYYFFYYFCNGFGFVVAITN
jgi:hypothetical protein